MSGEAWGWTAFGVAVAVLLAIDLLAHWHGEADNRRRTVLWSLAMIAAGLGFGAYVWIDRGPRAGQEYLAAYLLEESLSLDNLFVFLIIFRMMHIPKEHQRIALMWGVLGAVIFRGLFVWLGIEAIEHWAWVEYVFAALLIYAAFRAVREDPADAREDNKLVDWLRRRLPVSRPQEQPRFLVREEGLLKVTPLLIAVLGLEATDILFAIDSVPAAFSVTHDEFLIYTSNVFAILGLRSLYVVLAHTIAELKYLHYGLGAVLAFAGAKMLLGKAGIEIPPLASVAAIVLMIGAAAAASLYERRTRVVSDAEIDLSEDGGPSRTG